MGQERERERAELIYYLTYPQTFKYFKYDKYFQHFFTLHFGTVDSLYIWTVDIVGCFCNVFKCISGDTTFLPS